MKRKVGYLALPFLLLAMTVVFFAARASKAQGVRPCVRACQEAAIAAVQVCNGDLACLQAVRAQYVSCVSACRP